MNAEYAIIIHTMPRVPFQVKGRGWVDAANLKPYDLVYTKDWKLVGVHSVNLIELDEPVEVFNFEVEDCHTYFVGELGVLVHNIDCGSRGQAEAMVDINRGRRDMEKFGRHIKKPTPTQMQMILLTSFTN